MSKKKSTKKPVKKPTVTSKPVPKVSKPAGKWQLLARNMKTGQCVDGLSMVEAGCMRTALTTMYPKETPISRKDQDSQTYAVWRGR